ncbi:MAG: transcriptional repressor LexA [Planctomycetota bacterium]|jgi:repressor LexA
MPTYTVKQQRTLEIVRDMLIDRGLAPTLEEIGSQMGGISRVAVLDHLRALERKGAIRRRPRESRAIEILDPKYTPPRGLPLLGTIAAGTPILEVAEPDEVVIEEYLRIDDDTFLLRVAGNSMIEDHIQDGDLVLIEQGVTARDGETVVAVIEGETTLKRLYREGATIRLQPANSGMEPRVVPAEAVEVRGVLRGVIRRT